MAKSFVISGTTYLFPEAGANPPWGEDVTDWAEAVTDLLSGLSGTGDIAAGSANIANNQSSATDILGLTFDTATIRSAIISYSIYRTSSTTELAECGQVYIIYKSTAGTWELAQNYAGSSGVVISITNGGSVQYTSTNMSGISYSGNIRFSAKATLQT